MGKLCVSNLFQILRGRWRSVGVIFLMLAGFAASRPRAAVAHDLFTAYVQHGVHLTVGARNVDLTLDLTFFEEWSARERLVMDTDGNGRIARSEVEAYVKQLAPQVFRQVKLRVAGRELDLVPLYDPEIDLLANDKVGPGHHRLRLFFFAPTPPALRAGDEIVVEDSLWPLVKAIGTPQAEGHDGATVETREIGDPLLAPVRPDESRGFKFRCVKPPLANPVAPKTPASNPLNPAPPLNPRSQPLPLATTQTVP